jgi:hypothetical protein
MRCGGWSGKGGSRWRLFEPGDCAYDERLVEQTFAPDDMHDMHGVLLVPVDHPTGWLDDLAVAPASELGQLRAAERMGRQLVDMPEHPPHEFARGLWVLQSDVVGDGIEIGERGLRPDHFSHRDIRLFASACGTVRPSSMAFSPRAMPSSKVIRR